jgi:hypothetical protein
MSFNRHITELTSKDSFWGKKDCKPTVSENEQILNCRGNVSEAGKS